MAGKYFAGGALGAGKIFFFTGRRFFERATFLLAASHCGCFYWSCSAIDALIVGKHARELAFYSAGRKRFVENATQAEEEVSL